MENAFQKTKLNYMYFNRIYDLCQYNITLYISGNALYYIILLLYSL